MMTQRSAAAKKSGPRLRLFGDTIAELKKVVWLSRREVIYLTGIVLIVAVTIGVILGIFDYGFTRLVDDVFLGGL
jgi:preprotein translocase subunit SecE